MGDMPRSPGRYYLYLVRPDKKARQIRQFGGWLDKTEWAEPSDLDSFWLVISTQPGKTTIEPDSEDVLMISIAPEKRKHP
jgi:hypothetical protein